MAGYSESLVKLLKDSGYHLKQTPRTKFWEIFVDTDSAYSFRMGSLQARDGNSAYGNELKLKPNVRFSTQADSYKQDYERWLKRIMLDQNFKDRAQMKLALQEQYDSLLKYRKKLKTFPPNFNRLGEPNKNKLILPYHLAAIPCEIADYGMKHGLTAYHPIINGLTEKLINFTDLEDYEGLPRDWVRKLIFG